MEYCVLNILKALYERIVFSSFFVLLDFLHFVIFNVFSLA